mgnify:CR=1 FL=1|jgi:oligoribonuclease NrnB/cAMP/cGMP phosphodiesterase (DHH superfamily)
MGVKIFTHNDLDGIGCGILGLLAFDEVDIEYCNYNDINEKIEQFIKNNEYMGYNHIYITDISISEKLANKIDKTEPSSFKKGFTLAECFTLIDHHPTAMHLREYWWATIKIEDEKGKCSGTSLFYKYLLSDGCIELEKDNISKFVEMVRQYDTWEWATIYNNEDPKSWNDLLYVYGREIFIETIIKKFRGNGKFKFDETDLLLLKLEENKKERYFEEYCPALS